MKFMIRVRSPRLSILNLKTDCLKDNNMNLNDKKSNVITNDFSPINNEPIQVKDRNGNKYPRDLKT